MAHKDICYRFEVTDSRSGETRHFKAIGFLNDGEKLITGGKMLERVPSAIGAEDTEFLKKNADGRWSQDLFPYNLATGHRLQNDWRFVWTFNWVEAGHWWDGERKFLLDTDWDSDILVIVPSE